jgi:hypothetical protein
MASVQRRSLRLVVKNFKLALADADRFMSAARACWEQGLELPPAVLLLKNVADASDARCTPAAKRLLDACIADQPLPGYLEELRTLGTLRDFDLPFVLTEIEGLMYAADGWCSGCEMVTVILPNQCRDCAQRSII